MSVIKAFFKKVWNALNRFWFWALCITAVISLVVLFSGLRISLGSHTLWAGWLSRSITVVCLLILWGSISGLYYWRKQKKQLTDEQRQAAEEKRQQEEAVTEAIDTLRQRLDQAISTIRHSVFYKKRRRRSRYALPWYMIMGASGSGKSALLRHAELDFPLEKEQTGITKDLMATRHCEWNFANEAVLIDTSGNYTVQKEEKEQQVWRGFLRLLRQRRRRRPLNGIIFTLSAGKLTTSSLHGLEEYARKVRKRMRQISEELSSQVPVYLVITHMDTVTGFNEFFARLTHAERQQVVGVTFRDEQDGTQQNVVREEYEELVRRLNARAIMRLHEERSITARNKLLGFTPAMAGMNESLAQFIHLAFAETRYHRATAIRGFYFTSAPEVKESFDSVTLSTGQAAGMKVSALHAKVQRPGCFIKQLFESIIFAESELATLDTTCERRIKWNNRLAYGAAAAIVLGSGALWVNAFINNTHKQQLLQTSAASYHEQWQTLSPAMDVRTLLPVLNTLYNATQTYQEGESGWHTGLGLNQQTRMIPATEQRYQQVLTNDFLPAVARDLEDQMMSNLTNHDFLEKALTAYLMLNEKQHTDTAFLEQWMALDWSYRFNGDETVQKLLNMHLDNALKTHFAPVKLDHNLIARARQQLRKEPSVIWVYQSIKNSDAASALPAFHFADVLSSDNQVFSGADYAIPGLYTQQGYALVFLGQGLSLVRKAIENNWVLGEATDLSDMEVRRLYSAVENQYFRDYARYWTQALNRLQILKNNTLTQEADQVLAMTSGDQPLISIIQAVRKNTLFLDQNGLAKNIAGSDKGRSAPETPTGRLAAVASTGLKSVLAQQENTSAVHSLEAQFRDIDMLIPDGKNNAPVLDSTVVALNNLETRLQSVIHAADTPEQALDWASDHMKGRQGELSQLDNITPRLPTPIAILINDVENNSWHLVLENTMKYLNTQYKANVYTAYQQTVAPYYPFARHSNDMTMDDFIRFFEKKRHTRAVCTSVTGALYQRAGFSAKSKNARRTGTASVRRVLT